MDDIRISLDTTGAANDISVVRVDGVVDTKQDETQAWMT